MRKPFAVAQPVVAWQHRAVVVDLQLRTTCRRVALLVDVADLVRSGGFAEIGCPAEEIHGRGLGQFHRGPHGSKEDAAEVVDVDPVGQVGHDAAHARRPIRLICAGQCDALLHARFHQVAYNADGEGQLLRQIVVDFSDLFQRVRFDAGFDALPEQPCDLG